MPGRRDAPGVRRDRRAQRRPCRSAKSIRWRAEAPDAPFAHRLAGPPRYPAGRRAPSRCCRCRSGISRAAASAASYAITADGLRAQLLDSGSATTVWHRLYAEASIPPGTRLRRLARRHRRGASRRAGGRRRRLAPARLRARHRGARRRRDGPACAARRVGAGAVGAAGSSGAGAVDARARAARPVHGR